MSSHSKSHNDRAALDALLQPNGLRADVGGLPSDVGRLLGRPEHVDDIDRLRDIGERPVDPLAEQLVGERVHGNDPPAVELHLLRDRMRGLPRVARRADHRDGCRLFKDLARGSHGDCWNDRAAPRIPQPRARMMVPS